MYDVFPEKYDGTIKYNVISNSKPDQFTLNELGEFTAKESAEVDVLITNSTGDIQYQYLTLMIVRSVLYKGLSNNVSYNKDVQIIFQNAKESTVNGQSLSNGQIFKEEGDYQIELTDYANKITQISFTIDKTPPVFTVLPYDTQPTKEPVKVSVYTDVGQILSFTFYRNESHEFVAYDKAGNRNTITITIDHFDFDPPIVEGVTNNQLTNQPVTIIFNEGLATLNGKSL